MIWFTIALFVVSFLVTALLAPKPDIEDARAGSLDDVQFPRATEDAPIPLILGKVRLNGPNTLWYGDFSAVPITEKIKTGLFSSTRVTVAHTYYLGLDLGLGLGPGVRLREIYIDEERVWSGTTSSTVPEAGLISKPSLFGGYKEGGGWSGAFTYYPGSYSQPVNAYLESQIGAGDVPAYRGMSRIVFENNYIGESNQLRKMAFVLDKYTNALGTPNAGKIGDDMNPMEALYQVLTDPWIGLGISTSLIDNASFLAAGTTLNAEGNGCSIIVTSASQGKTVIQEILRQVDGIMYQDPETGKLKVRLIRQDYVVGDLPSFDEDDIIQVRNFTKTSWEDVVAQVKVSFPQREKESSAVAISQDMATANMIGRMKTVNMSFPFCYVPSLAADIASRERAQQSVPLFRMTLEMNRNAYTLRPGDVFRVSWPEYGLTDLVMRVQKHDFGELLNNKIVIDCIQDAFAVNTTIFATPEASGWTEPVTTPSDILVEEIVEMPYFYASRLEAPVIDGKADIIPFALRPTTASSGYDMAAGLTTGDANLIYRERSSLEYPATGTLTAAYDKTAGFTAGFDATGFTVTNVIGSFAPASGLAEIRDGEVGFLYVDGEWMAFTSASGSPNVTISNVYRGLFGSQIKTHAPGTRVWSFNIEMLGRGTLGIDLNEATTVYHKLLDRVGSLALDVSEVSETSTALNANGIADRPLRPRYLELDGSRSDAQVISDVVARDVEWRASNRAASQVTVENDPAETPDEAETYDVDVFVGGTRNSTLSGTGVSSPYSIPFNMTMINDTDCEVRVSSRRTVGNLRSSVAYAFIPFELAQAFMVGNTQYWDTYGGISAANLKGVYSLRRRVSTYAGALVRIRDTFDDSEQDVGQDARGNLATFSVTGEARVVTWYDQSGNSMDLTQATNANQPRLTTGTTSGRHARVEFGTVAGGGTHQLSSPTFSDASPNVLLIGRPTWFGDANWVANTYYQYAFNIPMSATTHYSPWYRFGILHEPDEGFEHRFNGNLFTYGSPWYSGRVGVIPWMIDAKSGSTIDTFFNRMDAAAANLAYSPNITVGGATSCVRIGSDGASGEAWNGSVSDFVVMDNATTEPMRDAIARELYYWHDNVVFLSSFDGADGATTATDDSITGHTMTFVGDAQLDTAQQKFGSASLLLDGTGDEVTVPNSAEFQFGSNQFTVDGHFRWNSVAAPTWLVANYLTTGNQRSWGIYWDGADLRLVGSNNGTAELDLVTPYTWTPTAGTWYHIAATFDGTTYRLFVDGAVVATGTTVYTLHNSTDLLRIGSAGGSSDNFNGWIDELRIINNRASWVGTFQPPSAAYRR